MNGGLRELLGLPELRVAGDKGGFGPSFRADLAELNKNMQVLAVEAGRADHQSLSSQRDKLIAAYQTASAAGDPNANQRIMDALGKVNETAATKITAIAAGREAWEKHQAAFDDAILRIGELEEAQHPKASVLRQLGEAIHSKVKDRQYRESLTALEQLTPRLEQIYSELQQDSKLANGQSLSAQERAALWQELAEIEQRIESLLAEHQITI